jgi:hypothetical protein
MNANERNSIVALFNQQVDKEFAERKALFGIKQGMISGNSTAVRNGVSDIRDMVISAIPSIVPVCKAHCYTACFASENGESIVSITVTIGSRQESKVDFKYSASIVGDNPEQKVFTFIKSIYSELIINGLAQINVDKVNAVLAKASADASLPYSVRLVTPLGRNGKRISYLSDDEVVFVADLDRLFNIDNMVVFMDGENEYVDQKTIESVYGKLVDFFIKAQTTVQLVAMHGGDLLSLLCNISKRLKPMTLISKVYSKNVMAMKSGQRGIGFFKNDSVFAVVAKNEDSAEVILKPIDINTLEPVEYDVLSAMVITE